MNNIYSFEDSGDSLYKKMKKDDFRFYNPDNPYRNQERETPIKESPTTPASLKVKTKLTSL